MAVPIPDRLLPEGVGPAWFDPVVMRLHAEAWQKAYPSYSQEIPTKSWVLLYLLELLEKKLEELDEDYGTEN